MIQNSGKVYTDIDKAAIQEWLDSGEEVPYGSYYARFEKELAKYVGTKHALFVNSGSSANLLAFAAFASPEMYPEWRIRAGDEIITLAASFPTTIAPIVQYGCVPVFLDIGIPDYNIKVEDLEKAVTKKTKGVFIAHTLGNPFDLDTVEDFCIKYNLFLIVDGCDAFGSLYKGKSALHYGQVSTVSMYAAHHFFTGHGGAVFTDDEKIKKITFSVRNWGKECRCECNQDNACGHRFTQQHGTLPMGYDHKFVFSNFGYNLNATNPQAALGLAQLSRIDQFTKQRHENFAQLYDGLKDLHGITLPKATEHSDPSWFGFPILLDAYDRKRIVQSLNKDGIGTRFLFAGNIVRQPCFTNTDTPHCIIGDLRNTDRVMNDMFWIGLWHGLTSKEIDIEIAAVRRALSEY